MKPDNSHTSEPAYYRVLEYVLRSYGSSRRRQTIYAVVLALLLLGVGVWEIANGNLPSNVVMILAILIVSVIFSFLFLIGPRAWDIISLEYISKERVEACASYIEQNLEEWELDAVSRMAENDRSGMQTVSALMNTLWPALIALMLAGELLPASATSYLVLAALIVFLVLPAALLHNSEREHADVVILQAIVACKERREKKARSAITRKLPDR
ncbi:MAG TPA: hypothetical protein VEX13_00025 [Chloroflexia bacterium]|nr:hypothetical protein [Chloroflexia bacterium]